MKRWGIPSNQNIIVDIFPCCFSPHGGVFVYNELVSSGKANPDIFWLRDESLEDSANLPAPDVLVQESIDNL